MQLCPGASILLTPISSPEELYTRYRSAVALDQGPDLLSLDTRWVVLLAADGLLHDLTDSVKPEFWQRYVPGAQETVRYRGRLYGLPVSMEVMALYYNTDLVIDPARDLADVMTHVYQEDLLDVDDWQALLEPYLAERSALDPQIAHRMHLYLALFPVFWLDALIRRGVRAAVAGDVAGQHSYGISLNQRLRRYLARGLAWPEREFEDQLTALTDVMFFPDRRE